MRSAFSSLCRLSLVGLLGLAGCDGLLGGGDVLGPPTVQGDNSRFVITGVALHPDDGRPERSLVVSRHRHVIRTYLNVRSDEADSLGNPLYSGLFEVESGVDAPPLATARGEVVLLAEDGIYGVVRYDGQEQWRHTDHRDDLGLNLCQGPDGGLFTADLGLLGLESDGALRWRVDLPARASTPVVHDDQDTVLVGGFAFESGEVLPAGYLIAVDAGTGEAQWQADLPRYPRQLSLGEDAAYLWSDGPNGGQLAALDRGTGSELWTLDGFYGAPVVGANGTLYQSGEPGVRAVSASGDVLWSNALGRCGPASLGANDRLYVACGPDTGQATVLATLWSLAIDDGAERPEGDDVVGQVLERGQLAPVMQPGMTVWVSDAPADDGNQQFRFDGGPGLALAPWPTATGDAYGRHRLWGASLDAGGAPLQED